MTRTILIVDDEPNMRWVLGRALEQAGYTVHSAESGDDAASLLGRAAIDLVLLDLKLKREDGLTILRRLRERQPDVVVIMLTAYGTVSNAVEAMQLGAADFLRKPFDVEEVVFKIARALERRAMQQELARLTVTRRAEAAFDTLVGAETVWHDLVRQASQLAATPYDLLIAGERGSGRTTVGRAIHVASPRHAAPLIELDLRAYHEAAQAPALFGSDGHAGAWGEAGTGSLLLHGLSEAPTLHAIVNEHIRSRPAGTRPRLLVVGDDAEPPESLRPLLPARLRVPPVRDRAGDILLLARHFAGERPSTPQVAQALERYQWPGNVSELRSVIERAGQLAGTGPLDVLHLPERLQRDPVAPPTVGQLPSEGINLDQLEQGLIRQALERARGNKSRAAELLGLTRHTLLYRMEKYNISAPERE